MYMYVYGRAVQIHTLSTSLACVPTTARVKARLSLQLRRPEMMNVSFNSCDPYLRHLYQ